MSGLIVGPVGGTYPCFSTDGDTDLLRALELWNGGSSGPSAVRASGFDSPHVNSIDCGEGVVNSVCAYHLGRSLIYLFPDPSLSPMPRSSALPKLITGDISGLSGELTLRRSHFQDNWNASCPKSDAGLTRYVLDVRESCRAKK